MAAEDYTPGYSTTAVAMMARRTLDSHGAFLRPHLRPGMRVLDLGCGPGTITLGIAVRVEPGPVVGLDQDAAQAEAARQSAAEGGIGNAMFRTGSAYALPFPDGGFDLVVAHALMEHLARPSDVLAEIRRVLSPLGIVALRSPDWGGHIITPDTDDLLEAISAYRELQVRNGGDVLVGRKLGPWLRSAGFDAVRVSATYEVYPSAALIAGYLAERLDAERDGGRHAAALRAWGAHPDALFAQAWVEAVGVRGSQPVLR